LPVTNKFILPVSQALHGRQGIKACLERKKEIPAIKPGQMCRKPAG